MAFDIAKRLQFLQTRGIEIAKSMRQNGSKRRDCEDCAGFVEGYMLEDELWAQICPNDPSNGFLCLFCAERRAGRPLVIEDFTNALVNLPIMYGYAIGKREPAQDIIQPWPEPASLGDRLGEFLVGQDKT